MNEPLISRRQLLRVLLPSSIGGTLTIVLAIAMVLVIMTPQFASHSDTARYSEYIQQKNTTDLVERSQRASEIVNSSPIAADASVFIIWGLTGLVSYSLVVGVIRIGRNALQFIRDVEYSKTDRATIEHEALVHVLVRLLAICMIFGYYVLFMNVLLPAIVVVTQMTLTVELPWSLAYATVSAIIAMISIHLAVILVRFVLLRTRIFFDRDYIPQ